MTSAILLVTMAIGQWELKTFGNADFCTQGLYLGPGVRGDGMRIVAASGWGGTGRGHEWRYSGGSWIAEEIYANAGIAYSPIVAAVRGPDLPRIYFGSYSDAVVYEVSYEAGSWKRARIEASAIDKVVCVRAAPGRNDGVTRLYFSHADAGAAGGLYELSWNESFGGFERLRVHGRDVGEFAVADARGDGLLRIYAGSREGGDGGVVEYTWTGERYEPTVISIAGALQGRIQTTYVGDGRGDGQNRLYANEWGGRLFELTWSEGEWKAIQVAGPANRFYLITGRVRADNRSRVYASVQRVGVQEYTWQGSQYEMTFDAITSATGQVRIGNGRGDGKNRLYAGRGNAASVRAAVVEASDPNPPDSDPSGRPFRRGDSNADGTLDVSDPVHVLINLFVAGAGGLPCEAAADPNGDGAVDVSDAVYLLNYLFLGGVPPVAPFPDCGRDSAPGALSCDRYEACP